MATRRLPASRSLKPEESHEPSICTRRCRHLLDLSTRRVVRGSQWLRSAINGPIVDILGVQPQWYILVLGLIVVFASLTDRTLTRLALRR